MKIALRGKILAIFLVLIALGCLFFLGWGGYLLFKHIWLGFEELDKRVAIPLVTVSVIAIIIAITLVIGKSIDKKREIKQQQMAQKVDFYKEFLQD
jgi:TRAP-type C4-dicarboxylate transport system permease small subunit